jgi:hypothetical protein
VRHLPFSSSLLRRVGSIGRRRSSALAAHYSHLCLYSQQRGPPGAALTDGEGGDLGRATTCRGAAAADLRRRAPVGHRQPAGMSSGNRSCTPDGYHALAPPSHMRPSFPPAVWRVAVPLRRQRRRGSPPTSQHPASQATDMSIPRTGDSRSDSNATSDGSSGASFA